MVFSRVDLGTNDLERAIAFYDAVLAPLGLSRYAINSDGQAKYSRGGPGFTAGGREAASLPAAGRMGGLRIKQLCHARP